MLKTVVLSIVATVVTWCGLHTWKSQKTCWNPRLNFLFKNSIALITGFITAVIARRYFENAADYDAVTTLLKHGKESVVNELLNTLNDNKGDFQLWFSSKKSITTNLKRAIKNSSK